ncbi:gp64 [Sphingomonas phage PAU]|uniref:gp64 n=1 Tax=Sphingomonas phage PAU TaxID=1150991 RepID=UPI00025731CA|nr:gp64 [Sphingomonas phage PAU]AFF28062.1 gp64 [Sphingomonas phage PAU]
MKQVDLNKEIQLQYLAIENGSLVLKDNLVIPLKHLTSLTSHAIVKHTTKGVIQRTQNPLANSLVRIATFSLMDEEFICKFNEFDKIPMLPTEIVLLDRSTKDYPVSKMIDFLKETVK